jgi:hypothetical protein
MPPVSRSQIFGRHPRTLAHAATQVLDRTRMSEMATQLLAFGTRGSSLRVAVSPTTLGRPLDAGEEVAFDALYEVDAYPFAGTLRDALLLSDLTAWHNGLARLRPPAELGLGGGRSAELQLHVNSGSDGRWAVEVQLRRTGDDPWPEIRYLVFGVEPFRDQALAATATLLGDHL